MDQNNTENKTIEQEIMELFPNPSGHLMPLCIKLASFFRSKLKEARGEGWDALVDILGEPYRNTLGEAKQQFLSQYDTP